MASEQSTLAGSAFSSTDGVAYNFGQQPFVQTPTVEGRLYQEWSQWARTTLGYLQDRIAKLEGENTDLRIRIEAALERIGSIESDEINDDAVDTTLLALVADLRARVEALEAG